MKIFKFGGASVKDAASIRNVVDIIEKFRGQDRLFVVVSAIGKTTNALEKVAAAAISTPDMAKTMLEEIVDSHKTLVSELMDGESAQQVFDSFEKILERTFHFLERNESINQNYIYDQIVSKGEVFSSLILSDYIKYRGLESKYINARTLIKTDSNYTDANILWDETREAVKDVWNNYKEDILVTQGFIGANIEMLYTTLGREGSDYTAAILAHCLNADELTIWKDVRGVYTADPKKFPEATLIKNLTYKEAIEMTFYGAQIIHPKTIKPIQNSNCILNVRSFIDKDSMGTQIGMFEIEKYEPVIVLKENQVLYTFSVKDFSFLNEKNLGKIIETFGKHNLRINLMQNTAIQFIVLTDEKIGKNQRIVDELSVFFDIEVKNNLKLLSIRHYTQETIDKIISGKEIFLTQKNPSTIQFLITN